MPRIERAAEQWFGSPDANPTERAAAPGPEFDAMLAGKRIHHGTLNHTAEPVGHEEATPTAAPSENSWARTEHGWDHPSGGVVRPSDEGEGLWQLWGPTATFKGRGSLAKVKQPSEDPNRLMAWYSWAAGEGPKPEGTKFFGARGDWRTNPLIPYGHDWDEEQRRFMPDPDVEPLAEGQRDPRRHPGHDIWDTMEERWPPQHSGAANVSDAELRHLAMIDEDAAEWRRRQVASHDLERSAPREMKARRQEPVAPRTPRTAIQGGEEKSWANGGYSGTVDDQLHAMDDTQRDEVYTEHPWLRPHGEDGSRF